ncbi:MAG: BamA/TamA family outer membrane protein [Bacteroidales bacterium]|nr:BamA/TamA family outer membrane protein [Bacteroidales bacterium]
MRRFLPLIFLLFFAAQANGQTQENPSGWKAIPLPILSFNTDLGFQFGANTEVYYYGEDPSIYPEYKHKFHAEVSHYTKGQTLAHIEYDSSYLIPGIRFSTSFTAQVNPLYNFYGFGGDITQYDREYDRRNGYAYYNYKRSLFKFIGNFQGRITKNIHWVGGVSFYHYSNEELNFKDYDYQHTLFHFYRENGVIRDNETKGAVLEFKAGLSFDTRNQETTPTKGIWAEAYCVGAPDVFNSGYSYLKLILHFRHYLTPFRNADWFTFAYHLAYQGTIAGEAPFYIQQNIYTLLFKQAFSEGLGGLNTVRGLFNSRLVGDAYAWANIETRFRLYRFNVLGMNCYIGLNPFFDMGMITKPIRLNELSLAYGAPVEELKSIATRLHKSVGIGFKFGMDENYVFSLECAKAFNNNDGPFSLMTSINYIF